MCVILPIDTQDNKTLTSLVAAEYSVSSVGVALVFNLRVSWLAQKVASALLGFEISRFKFLFLNRALFRRGL